MAPFVINHPSLFSNWIVAKETALARVRALCGRLDPPAQARFLELLERAQAERSQLAVRPRAPGGEGRGAWWPTSTPSPTCSSFDIIGLDPSRGTGWSAGRTTRSVWRARSSSCHWCSSRTASWSTISPPSHGVRRGRSSSHIEGFNELPASSRHWSPTSTAGRSASTGTRISDETARGLVRVGGQARAREWGSDTRRLIEPYESPLAPGARRSSKLYTLTSSPGTARRSVAAFLLVPTPSIGS